LILLASCRPAPKLCPACERPDCAGMTFNVTLASGKVIETCCPRCGAAVVRQQTAAPRALTASDFSSGQPVGATLAVYVVGSDVSHCAGMEMKRDAEGCCMFKGYDRCLPSTLAFATHDAAVDFQKKHGGALTTWSDVLAH